MRSECCGEAGQWWGDADKKVEQWSRLYM